MFAASKTASVSGGYQISRSLRFNSADSAYLNRTPASAGNKQTWTLSVWVKRAGLSAFMPIYSAGPVSPRAYILLNSSDKLDFRSVDSGNTEVIRLTTTQVFRDPSAWYHIVVAQDTTQATSSNRVKIYVNGTQITAFDTATYPTQNISNLAINDALEQNYGRYVNSPSDGYLSAYLTETNFIDGQALTPSSFGETNAQTGVWQPKAYSGSYGTNGFYLNFSDNSNTTAATLGKDYSGNGNNWTPNNFSVTAGAGNDSLVDSPTSYGTDTGVGGTVRGNYATLNPLSIGGTLANGNLDYSGPSGTAIAPATIGMSSGKWYFEMTATSTGVGCGVSLNSASLTQYLGQNTSGWGYFTDGLKYTNNSGSSYGATFTTGDVIGVAFDADAGTLVFYKNGTSQGTAFSSLTSGPYFFTVSDGSSPDQRTCTTNFGQRPFAYTAPSGFKALCTQNLPTPTIGATASTLANKYFDINLWTGNGTSQTLTNTGGFQPDWVWLKSRSSGTNFHNLYDVLRGATKHLFSNSTAAEGTNTQALTAFTSTGFSVGNDNDVNQSSGTYVGWQWKAGGTGVTNTSGTITSTVSANTTSGFSVVTYTGNGTAGATIGHGLGVAPSMMFIKGRSNVDNWHVYSSALGNTGGMFLNLTNAFTVSTYFWNNTSPTSTVFTVSSGSSNNASGVTYVAYCFAEVAGYSKFGSYTGNGSTNFIYTGFRPAYVLIRRTNTAAGWGIIDSARNSINSANKYLNANASDAEGVGTAGSQYVDLLSNGFKCLDSSAGFNASGDNYIYMAFAEAPFKYSLAR